MNGFPSNSVNLTWVDPAVDPDTQLPLASVLIFENDLTAMPPTQTEVGSVAPGVEEWNSGYVLPAGANRTYQVQGIDTAGTPGPISDASNAVTTAAPTFDPPSKPGTPSASLQA